MLHAYAARFNVTKNLIFLQTKQGEHGFSPLGTCSHSPIYWIRTKKYENTHINTISF